MPPPDDDAQGEAPERKPFAMALQEMRKGGLHTEMSDELAALVVRCMETGKKGSITLTLTINPLDPDTCSISDKISLKTPRPNAEPSVFFPDKSGNISRQNLNQLSLGEGLREVKGRKNESGATPLKEAGS